MNCLDFLNAVGWETYAFVAVTRVALAMLATVRRSPLMAAAQLPLTTLTPSRRTTRTSNRSSSTTTTMVSALTLMSTDSRLDFANLLFSVTEIEADHAGWDFILHTYINCHATQSGINDRVPCRIRLTLSGKLILLGLNF